MSDATRKQGQADANAGKGPKNPNEFTNAHDRKDYEAAYNNAKKK